MYCVRSWAGWFLGALIVISGVNPQLAAEVTFRKELAPENINWYLKKYVNSSPFHSLPGTESKIRECWCFNSNSNCISKKRSGIYIDCSVEIAGLELPEFPRVTLGDGEATSPPSSAKPDPVLREYKPKGSLRLLIQPTVDLRRGEVDLLLLESTFARRAEEFREAGITKDELTEYALKELGRKASNAMRDPDAKRDLIGTASVLFSEIDLTYKDNSVILTLSD